MTLYAYGTADQLAILAARHAFVEAYCRERGWSVADLTFEQIMEIRAQPGWKEPVLGSEP